MKPCSIFQIASLLFKLLTESNNSQEENSDRHCPSQGSRLTLTVRSAADSMCTWCGMMRMVLHPCGLPPKVRTSSHTMRKTSGKPALQDILHPARRAGTEVGTSESGYILGEAKETGQVSVPWCAGRDAGTKTSGVQTNMAIWMNGGT